jgi:hypothetical protein
LSWVEARGLECEFDPDTCEGSFWSPNIAGIGCAPVSRRYKENVENVVANILHEYAHYYQLVCGMWRKYLSVNPTERSQTQTLRAYMRTALRCERHADALAAGFLTEIFGKDCKLDYSSSYDDEETVKSWKLASLAEPQRVLKHRRNKRK